MAYQNFACSFRNGENFSFKVTSSKVSQSFDTISSQGNASNMINHLTEQERFNVIFPSIISDLLTFPSHTMAHSGSQYIDKETQDQCNTKSSPSVDPKNQGVTLMQMLLFLFTAMVLVAYILCYFVIIPYLRHTAHYVTSHWSPRGHSQGCDFKKRSLTIEKSVVYQKLVTLQLFEQKMRCSLEITIPKYWDQVETG